MKTFVSFLFVMMMSVMTSFSQVYVVHVDTLQHFEHPATITTFDAIQNDMMVYTGTYVSDIDFTFDFNQSEVSTNNHYNGYKSKINIIEKMNVSENFEIDVMSEDNKITRIFVDPALNPSDGIIMMTRWNEMKNGVPTTCGWFSKNVKIKKGS